MSFPPADLPSLSLYHSWDWVSWQHDACETPETSDNFNHMSAAMRPPETTSTSKARAPLDMSSMATPPLPLPLPLGNPPHLSLYHNPDRPWYEVPRLQDSSHYTTAQDQGHCAAGGNQETAAPMLQFEGNMMRSGQGHLQGRQTTSARPRVSPQPVKRRSRLPKDSKGERSQKRKKTTAKQTGCGCGIGGTYEEDCNSSTGSGSTCCSSCSDGLPCGDPHCAIPCASCVQPICPEDCPLTTGPQGQQKHFQQGLVPSAERLSFLQQGSSEPWNPVSARASPSIKEGYLDSCIDPALTDPDVNSHYNPGPDSSHPPTPSLAQNLATPFSPEALLQTPQYLGQVPHIPYNEGSAIAGAGGMFNPSMGDWVADSLGDAGQLLWNTPCPWDACKAFIPDAQFWTQHFHQAHLDPQYSYGCPLQQSNDCPPMEANPLNHLQTQHGYDMNKGFSCPAPTCSPAETYNDPAMLRNHFDQAHATPAQGVLQCRVNSCNGSFSDQNQLFSHITKSHQLPVPPPKLAHGAVDQTQAATYPLAIPDNESLIAHTCKWKVEEGGICGESCGTEKDLQSHVKMEHLAPLSKSTGYICQWEHCSRLAKMGVKQGFSQRGKLERHMASHTNFKCSECDICHQLFSAEQAMKQHRLLHTGEKPWKCRYCDKRFPQQSACTIHERTHTKAKPLVCDVCGKKFSESSNFAKHRRIHGEMGKHACTVPGCGKHFHRSDQLKKHVRTMHARERVGSGEVEGPSSDAGSL